MATTTETLIDGLGGKGFYAKAAGLAQKAIKDKDGNDIDSTYVKNADLPTVDQTYNATSSHAQSGYAVAQALSGTGQVPPVQSTDDGKVLKATYSGGAGSFAWESDSSNMPSPQAADENKVLGVIDDQGTMDWIYQTPAQVNADWNASAGVAEILNKPSIPTVNDSTITIKVGSTAVDTFTTNQSSNKSISIPMATTTVSGAMSSADKGKLDGIEVGAEQNVKPDWNAASGAVAEILNKPSLATVATSGSYNDLTDKPTIPSVPVTDVQVDGVSVVASGVAEITLPTFTQTQADWDESSSSSDAYINNKPDLSVYAQSANLATVATSGDYADLTNKPTIPAAQVNADWEAASGVAEILHKPDLSVYAQSSSLSTVATSGDYDDLQNKPTIPSAANDSTVTVDMAGTQSGTNRSVGSFTVDQAAASTISIPVAVSGTKTSGTYTTHAQPGVMSYSDKEKLDDIESGAEVNEIQSISVNGTAVSPDANRNVDVTVPVTHMLAAVEVASDGWYLVDVDDVSQAHITYTQLTEWMTKNDTVYLQDEGFLYRIDLLVVTSGSKSVQFVGSSNSECHFEDKNDYVYNSDDPFTISGVNGISVNGTYLPLGQTGMVDISTSDLAAASPTGAFLKDDGTWAVPAGKTYTAGSGIAISNQDVLSVKTDGSTIHTNASGELEVIGGGGGGSIDGVKLDGAASALTPDVNQVVTIPNAIATGETGATNGLMTADDKKTLGNAIQYVENPYDQSSPKNLIAQQMFVVESDQQIIDIVTSQSQLINGKGTLFFRITGI